MTTPQHHRVRARGVVAAAAPPVAGMPVEVWSWLCESVAVRPAAVAAARARLAAGDRPSAIEVADALLALS